MSVLISSQEKGIPSELLKRIRRLNDRRGSSEVFLVLALREVMNFEKWQELGFQTFANLCSSHGLDHHEVEIGVRVVDRFLADGCDQSDLIPIGLDRLICIHNYLETIPDVLDLRRLRKLFDVVLEDGLACGDLTGENLAQLVGQVQLGGRQRSRDLAVEDADSTEAVQRSVAEQRRAVFGQLSSQILRAPRNRRPARPAEFAVSEEVWQMLWLTAMLGNNAHLVGPTGSGKSTLVVLLAKVVKRPCYQFNFGGILDPRSELLGTTQLRGGETVFVDSPFLRAIQVPNAVILLDEFNRCDGMFLNLLTPALINERTLEVAERTQGTSVKVAEGVSFFAVSNHGPEYVHTVTLDRAVVDRFQATIVVNYPPPDEEEQLLRQRFPSLPASDARALVKLADNQRQLARSGEYKTYVSTRMLLAAAEIATYTESLWWAVHFAITNKLSDAGENSERIKFRLLAQKYIRS